MRKFESFFPFFPFFIYIYGFLICKRILAEETHAELSTEELNNNFSIRILKKSSTKCGLQMNDEAEIEIRTFAPGISIMPHIVNGYKFGYANQTFIVGKHNVTPLNKGLIGMCVGELRRIGILVGNIGKIYYEVTLTNYKRNTDEEKEKKKEDQTDIDTNTNTNINTNINTNLDTDVDTNKEEKKRENREMEKERLKKEEL